MLILIEGMEKAGKSTLVAELGELLEPSRTDFFHTKRDSAHRKNGRGYLPHIITAIDSIHKVQIWDRAWISEAIYGRIFNEEREATNDVFYNEWVYGRLTMGRGARVILFPEVVEDAEKRRTESDVKIAAKIEAEMFLKYGKKWGYNFMNNDYTERTLEFNSKAILMEAMRPQHHIHTSKYIGPTNPSLVFVGPSETPFYSDPGGVIRPFAGKWEANHFRPFRNVAITRFGYANQKYFWDLPEELQNMAVAVGGVARETIGRRVPTTPLVDVPSEPENVLQFVESVMGAYWYYYGRSFKDVEGLK